MIYLTYKKLKISKIVITNKKYLYNLKIARSMQNFLLLPEEYYKKFIITKN
jgi:hypothetical protein